MSISTLARLSRYKRVLETLQTRPSYILSRELARLANVSSSLVRRDLMLVAVTGRPNRGYATGELLGAIGEVLKSGMGVRSAIIGAGNLGTGITNYLVRTDSQLAPVAIFDNADHLINGEVSGIRIYCCDDMEEVIVRKRICMVILTVPARAAPGLAIRAHAKGINSFVNFTGINLNLPQNVHVEEIDLVAHLDRAGFFAQATSKDFLSILTAPSERQPQPGRSGGSGPGSGRRRPISAPVAPSGGTEGSQKREDRENHGAEGPPDLHFHHFLDFGACRCSQNVPSCNLEGYAQEDRWSTASSHSVEARPSLDR